MNFSAFDVLNDFTGHVIFKIITYRIYVWISKSFTNLMIKLTITTVRFVCPAVEVRSSPINPEKDTNSFITRDLVNRFALLPKLDLFAEVERFPQNICDRCGMQAGDNGSSGKPVLYVYSFNFVDFWPIRQQKWTILHVCWISSRLLLFKRSYMANLE